MTKAITPIERAWLRLSLVAQRDAQIAELSRQRLVVRKERAQLEAEILHAAKLQEKWSRIVLGGQKNLRAAVCKYEGEIISYALRKHNKTVTHAAAFLGMHFQALVYTISARHPELLKERSKVRTRRKREG